MNKLTFFMLLFMIFNKAQKKTILRKAIFYPVRISFEDTIYDNNPYRKSFKSFVEDTKWDSIKNPVIINFEGKFKDNRIAVYDIGIRDVFDLKDLNLKELITFKNVTTNKIRGTTDIGFVVSHDIKRNTFLIQLNDGNSFIVNISDNYHIINVYFNREKKYWHLVYSNYTSVHL